MSTTSSQSIFSTPSQPPQSPPDSTRLATITPSSSSSPQSLAASHDLPIKRTLTTIPPALDRPYPLGQYIMAQRRMHTHGSLTAQDTFEMYEPKPLDDIITEMVRCDDVFCPDYSSMESTAIEVIMNERFPATLTRFSQCVDQGKPMNDCQRILNGGMQQCSPILLGLLNHQRIKSSTDPLIGYTGGDYKHSFWFQGIGDIWRRTASNSRTVTAADCQVPIRESERCFEDPNKVSDGTCFKLYSEALACESGANCPYLQYPLLSCLSRQDIIDTGEYALMKDCLFQTPNFRQCQRDYVDPTDQVIYDLGFTPQDLESV